MCLIIYLCNHLAQYLIAKFIVTQKNKNKFRNVYIKISIFSSKLKSDPILRQNIDIWVLFSVCLKNTYNKKKIGVLKFG